jgi:hypothetical protein
MGDTSMKQYVWYVADTDELIELNQAPEAGNEDKTHMLTFSDSEGHIMDQPIGLLYIGEL